MRKSILFAVYVFVFGLVMNAPSSAVAQVYMGEYVWTTGFGETFIMGVTHMGGSNYSLQGTVESTDGDLAVVTGSAVATGNDVIMTLTYTTRWTSADWEVAVIVRFSLNYPSLDGMADSWYIYHDNTGSSTNATSSFSGNYTVTFQG